MRRWQSNQWRRKLFGLGFLLATVLAIHAQGQSEPVYWIAYKYSLYSGDSPCSGLCIVRSDGREVRLVTENIHSSSPLAWSPDGQTIAFIDRDGHLSAVDITRRIEVALLTYDVILGLLPGSDSDALGVLAEFRVSPVDNLVWHGGEDEAIVFDVQLAPGMSYSPYSFFRLDLDGTRVTQLTNYSIVDIFGTRFETLANETLLLGEFSRCRYCDFDGVTLFSLNINTRETVRLSLDENFLDIHPTFSVDSDQIYYFHWDDYDYEVGSVVRVSLDGTVRDVLVDGLRVPSYTEMTFTRSDFYFLAADDRCYKVHVVDLTSGEMRVLSEDSPNCFYSLARAPQGDRVAMYGYSGSPSRGYGLFVMDSNDEVYSVIDGYDGRYTILAVTWSSVPIEE